jgi:gluconolactonase
MKNVYVLVAVLFVAILGLRSLGARTPAEELAVARLDPALDRIISSNSRIQIAADGVGGDGFTEGTNWVQHGKIGFLLFSDIPGNVIYRMTANGALSVYLDRSGYTGPFNGHTMLTVGGSTNYPFIDLGSDGLTLDLQGRLIICAFGNRAVERLEKDGERTILADNYGGKRFNGPNDVVVKKDGTIYFSDTFSGLRRSGPGPNAPRVLTKDGLDHMFIFMIKRRTVSPVINDIVHTNGLAFSPGERYLYVTAEGNSLKRYDVQADDTVTNGQTFIDMRGSLPGYVDGIRVDSKGNIYSTGPGGVWIISPEGKHLGTILTSKMVANLTFGDPDWKTVYMAAGSTIYKIRVNTPGLPCNSCSKK